MKPEIKHVGLMLYTIINGEMYGTLHKRGEWNHEKNQPESWAGGCQPTVHGKVEALEDPNFSLAREISEEIGTFMRVWFSMTPLVPTQEEGYEKIIPISEEGLYIVGLIPSTSIRNFSLGPSSGGIRLVTEKQIPDILDMKNFPKENRIPSEFTAMFSDDKKFLQAGFEVFRPRKSHWRK